MSSANRFSDYSVQESRYYDHDINNRTHQVAGALSLREVREKQTLNYRGDQQSYKKKQFEKDQKRKAELFKRYDYLFKGRTLSDNVTENQTEEDDPYTRIEKLERENEHLRRAMQRDNQEENGGRIRHVDTGTRLVENGIELENGANGDANDRRKKEKEEAFREEMRIAREKMQKLYNEKMKK